MGDRDSPLRGEAARVAARVRQIVGVPDDTDDTGDADEVGSGAGARAGVLLDPGRRAVLGVAVAVVLAALVTGFWVVHSRAQPVAVAARPVSGGAPRGPASGTVPLGATLGASLGAPTTVAEPASSPVATQVVVDVAGKVRRPGLYRLPPGSRIDDAITAAGGPRRGVDLSSLNLAAVLVDGQQVLVGVPGGAPPVPVVGGTVPAGSSAAIAPVSLNTATLEQLETLPRVGPVTAQKILDYRSAHGTFTSIDQLKDVSGIGDVTFAGLAPLVTL